MAATHTQRENKRILSCQTRIINLQICRSSAETSIGINSVFVNTQPMEQQKQIRHLLNKTCSEFVTTPYCHDTGCVVLYGNELCHLDVIAETFVKHTYAHLLGCGSAPDDVRLSYTSAEQPTYKLSQVHSVFDKPTTSHLSVIRDMVKSQCISKSLSRCFVLRHLEPKAQLTICSLLDRCDDADAVFVVLAPSLGTVCSRLKSRSTLINASFDKVRVQEFVSAGIMINERDDHAPVIERMKGLVGVLRRAAEDGHDDFVVGPIRRFVQHAVTRGVPVRILCQVLVIDKFPEEVSSHKLTKLAAESDHLAAISTSAKAPLVYERLFLELYKLLRIEAMSGHASDN